jgi:Transposase IS116/IS110/IS902 family
LCSIPGVQRRTAEVIIAETGGDMSAFPGAKHLASWAGICPGNDESAGKRRSGRTRKGSKWLRAALTEAAKAASRTRNTYLAAHYQRLRARRGHNKATTAVAHSMLVAAWHILTTGQLYTDPGPDYFTRRDPARTTRRLVAQLERLAYNANLQQTAARPSRDFSSDPRTLPQRPVRGALRLLPVEEQSYRPVRLSVVRGASSLAPRVPAESARAESARVIVSGSLAPRRRR